MISVVAIINREYITMCSNQHHPTHIEGDDDKLRGKGVEFGKVGRCMQQLLQHCQSEVNDVTRMNIQRGIPSPWSSNVPCPHVFYSSFFDVFYCNKCS